MNSKASVGVRLPQEYLDDIDKICKATGKSRSQIMVEAVEVFLKKTPPSTVMSTLEEIKHRLEVLEKKVAGKSIQR
jgi:predicted DNA-binding protein